jgi:hypothetical protein
MHTSRARNGARRPDSEVITVRAISARQRRPTRLARILGLDRNPPGSNSKLPAGPSASAAQAPPPR